MKKIISITILSLLVIGCGKKDEEKKYTKFYEDGTVVYFNPVTGKKCDSTESVSTTGTKEGCMKWYSFLDSEGSEKVNLILDHNTTATTKWTNQSHDKNPDVVTAQLYKDVENWDEDVKETARLITAEEVNKIAPMVPGYTWDKDDITKYYSLHTGSQTKHGSYAEPVEAGTNRFAWLFENTYECTNFGCNEADNITYGYWTSTAPANSIGRAWRVSCDGSLATFDTVSEEYEGVRPVITISKSLIK